MRGRQPRGDMQDAKFSRGKKEILAFGSIVLVGNLDVGGKLPHEKYYHLFEPLPSFLQVEALYTAFRIPGSAYLPDRPAQCGLTPARLSMPAKTRKNVIKHGLNL